MTDLELDKLDWKLHDVTGTRASVELGTMTLRVCRFADNGLYDIYVWRGNTARHSHLDLDPILAQSMIYYYAELSQVTSEVT